MRLFLFALLFRFDKKLFYPFVLRTISTFNRYAYCVVARSVVNIQHSTGCLIVGFPGMTSLLPKVNRSSGAYFQTFFSKIFLFFYLPQYSNRFDYNRDRRRAIYFNNQKNHCISSLSLLRTVNEQKSNMLFFCMVLMFALILTTVGISFICWIDDKKSHLKRVFRA